MSFSRNAWESFSQHYIILTIVEIFFTTLCHSHGKPWESFFTLATNKYNALKQLPFGKDTRKASMTMVEYNTLQ